MLFPDDQGLQGIQLPALDVVRIRSEQSVSNELCACDALWKHFLSHCLNTVAQELQSLPLPMFQAKSVLALCNLYEESFVRVTKHDKPKASGAEESFSEMLRDIKDRHRMVQVYVSPVQGYLHEECVM